MVVGLVGCLVFSSLFAGDHLGRPDVSDVARFVPADGTAWYGSLRNADGTTGASTPTVTESAVVDGTAVAGAVDLQLGGALLSETGAAAAARSRYWRLSTTTLGDPVSRDTQVYRVDHDLVRVGESGPGRSYRYSPGLVELPSRVTAGSTWESSGTAGAGVTYASRLQADDAEHGCLRVSGTIGYLTGSKRLERQVSRTWCPGQGVTQWRDSSGSVEMVWSRAERPPLAAPDTVGRGASGDPTRWRPRALRATAFDPSTGPAPMHGTPGNTPPVITDSGVLVRTTVAGQDLVGFGTGSQRDAALRWRAHPGGTVLEVVGFGDVLVATTSTRRVVAYDDRGVRLWDLGLDEVVMTAPVRASDDELALVTMAGEVLLVELRSGEVRWRRTPGSDVGVALALTAGVLTVVDRAGHLTGLDRSTGSVLWRADLPSVQFQAASGSVLAVVSDGDLYGVDPRTGRRLWRSGYRGIERGVASFGDWVVVLHVGGATAYDAAGTRVWDAPDVHAVTPSGPVLVRWRRAGADVMDRTKTVLTSFSTPEDTAGNTQRYVAGPSGVYLTDATWKILGWDRA